MIKPKKYLFWSKFVENTGLSIKNGYKDACGYYPKVSKALLKNTKVCICAGKWFQKANRKIKVKNRHGTYTTKTEFDLGK